VVAVTADRRAHELLAVPVTALPADVGELLDVIVEYRDILRELLVGR